MSGLSWEQEVANYLEEKGYSTRIRKEVEGHEIDIYGTKDDETLVVECKDWNSKVSADSVRRCQSVVDDIGGKPVIAYTSDLSPGAEKLAEKWDFITLSADIVRGKVITLEDVSKLVNEYELCLPDEEDLSKLDDPLGPFIPDQGFAGQVAQSVYDLTLESLSRSQDWIKQRIMDLNSRYENHLCVPVLRQDKRQIDLFYINLETHDSLPPEIVKEMIEL